MNEFSGAEAIAVAALVFGIVKILTGPIGRVIAERLRRAPPQQPDPALASEVDTLRTRLAEVEERLDFAERLLASARQADQLPGGAHR
jgi:F0F1-type ATP synthase membrane subunit b/b'